MSVLKTEKDTAKHLAHDYFINGNILYCTHQAMLTTSGKTSSLIVGQNYVETSTMIPYVEGVGENASFTEITSFAQMNQTHVLLADSHHGCIRSVNRKTNSTRHVAGLCQRVSWADELKDGDLQTSRFYIIGSITYHNHIIYAVESFKRRIRKIDLLQNSVKTLVDPNSLRQYDAPGTIVADYIRRQIFVSTYFGVAQIDATNNSFKYLTHGKERGDKVGHLKYSEWNGATAMTFVPNDTLVIADTLNSKIKIINLNTSKVSTWCFSYAKSKKSCSYIRSPKSFLVRDKKLYLSIDDTISMIDLPTWFTYESTVFVDDGLVYQETADTSAHTLSKSAGLCEIINPLTSVSRVDRECAWN